MSRLRLAQHLANQFHLDPQTTSEIIQSLTQHIVDEVHETGRCHLRGFGVFHLVNLKPKTAKHFAKDPSKAAAPTPRAVIRFKSSKAHDLQQESSNTPKISEMSKNLSAPSK